MGVGRDGNGWHPTEDFRWGTEFAAFLKAMDAQGQGRTDLIINGDAFDLLQAGKGDCTYDDPALGCTATEALARLERVLAAHDAEMKALGAFARSGSNRIVFLPGDHDAALLFPALSARVIKAVSAPVDRVAVAATGDWRSPDGQIYVEHGHQIGFSADKFERWPTPFVERAGREHLIRPWGEQIIQRYYNDREAKYPLVDNVAEEGAGVKFALTADGATDAGPDARQMLRYFLFKMSWQQFRTQLVGGEVQPAVWDLAKVREEGAASLVSALPDDDRFKPLAAKALADGRLGPLTGELSDDELIALCDYRAAVRRMRRRVERTVTQFPPVGPVVPECPRTPETRGPMFEYFWRTRDVVVTRHLEAVAERLPRTDKPIAVFVRGHTHLAEREGPSGFVPSRTARTPIVIDDGAWQRIVTPAQLDVVKKERGMSDEQLLRLGLEQLAPCYSFVHVPPYTDVPKPSRRFWRAAEKGGWELAPLGEDEDRAVQLLEQLSPCTRPPVSF
jgi:UDP-2,3-diacylglucosamine pyrophosphatase LpxH